MSKLSERVLSGLVSKMSERVLSILVSNMSERVLSNHSKRSEHKIE